MKIKPRLDWKKCKPPLTDDFNIDNYKNIFFAPQQHLKTYFCFDNYPDNKFHVEIEFETLNKKIKYEYEIDITYQFKELDTRTKSKNEIDGLDKITESIQELSDKFL